MFILSLHPPIEEEEKKAWPGISWRFLHPTHQTNPVVKFMQETRGKPAASSQSARSVFELIVLWLVFIRTTAKLRHCLVKAGKEKGGGEDGEVHQFAYKGFPCE